MMRLNPMNEGVKRTSTCPQCNSLPVTGYWICTRGPLGAPIKSRHGIAVQERFSFRSHTDAVGPYTDPGRYLSQVTHTRPV